MSIKQLQMKTCENYQQKNLSLFSYANSKCSLYVQSTSSQMICFLKMKYNGTDEKYILLTNCLLVSSFNTNENVFFFCALTQFLSSRFFFDILPMLLPRTGFFSAGQSHVKGILCRSHALMMMVIKRSQVLKFLSFHVGPSEKNISVS